MESNRQVANKPFLILSYLILSPLVRWQHQSAYFVSATSVNRLGSLVSVDFASRVASQLSTKNVIIQINGYKRGMGGILACPLHLYYISP